MFIASKVIQGTNQGRLPTTSSALGGVFFLAGAPQAVVHGTAIIMGSGASKVAFRDVLQELGENDISVEDASFWSKLWRTESTPHVRAALTCTVFGLLLLLRIGNTSAVH